MAKKERYRPWQINDFTAGKIDKSVDSKIPDNAARDCQNFISVRVGSMEKRGGQKYLNGTELEGPIRGLYAYYYNGTRRLIAVSHGKAYYWNGSAFVKFNDSLSQSADMLFETCVNYMVAFNGVDAPWKWDGTTVSTLANAPAEGRYPALHKEKLFCVDADEPSTLKWSNSFEPEEWPEVNYWDIRKGDGDEITCLMPEFAGELIIFKERSIHTLKGTSLDDFALVELESSIGCVGPRAAARHGLQIYFVGNEGLYMTNGMSTVNLSEARIPDTWETINKQYLNKAVVGVWNGLIRFDLPEEDSTYNNFTLFYNPVTQAFWPMRGLNVSCYQTYNNGSRIIFYSGSSSNGYVIEQDTGTEDFGSPIEAYWKGRYYDMGVPELQKKSRKAYIQDSPQTSRRAILSVSLDYGEYNNLDYNRTEKYTREYLFSPGANRWNHISPMVYHNSSGNCEVRGILIPYKPKPTMGVRET